jgi:hypothetical protein
MYIVYTRVIMKIEIKPTGYGRMRFIGIDILLPCIDNYRKKTFRNSPNISKTERAKCIDMGYI